MQKKIFQVPTVLQNRSFFNVVILYIYMYTDRCKCRWWFRWWCRWWWWCRWCRWWWWWWIWHITYSIWHMAYGINIALVNSCKMGQAGERRAPCHWWLKLDHRSLARSSLLGSTFFPMLGRMECMALCGRKLMGDCGDLENVERIWFHLERWTIGQLSITFHYIGNGWTCGGFNMI